ncbi:MAG: DUF5666 domain-containing protein [Gammaproteobacteria bacterium]|nr:DUF5666 domain-containing protein [Gammaproteobacteria bacterium]
MTRSTPIKRLRLPIGLFLAAFCGVLLGGSPGGGIGGTGITGFGQIQAFGSVFVNGREYFLNATTRVTVDGQPSTGQALHIGDIVIVRGSADPGSRTGQAQYIQVEHALLGRVDEVTGAGARFTVLGQRVYLAPAARIEGPDNGPVALHRGDVVAVSALAKGNGAWVATRVTRLYRAQRVPASQRFILQGTVAGVDRERGVIRIGTQPVAVKATALDTIRTGEQVRVEGHYLGKLPEGTQLRPVRALPGGRGEYVEMEGYAAAPPRGDRLSSNGIVIRYPLTAKPSIQARIRAAAGRPLVFVGRLRPDGALEAIRIETPQAPRLPDAGGADKPGASNPHMEPPEVTRPEIEHPEIERPQIEPPEIQRPDLPSLQRPDL